MKIEDVEKTQPKETPPPTETNDTTPKSSAETDDSMNRMMGFYQSLQTYMNSPEVIEMQRKNLALTQNFMIYQQLFQVYLMMNFKKKLETPQSLANALRQFSGMPELKKEDFEQAISGKENSESKLPPALQNMMNFINSNIKDKNANR